MDILLSMHSGYCYVVNRAIKMTLDASEQRGGPIYTLGPLIHNPQVINKPTERGIFPVEDIHEVEGGGIIIVRCHGIDPKVILEAKNRGLRVIDATCPYVRKVQDKASLLVREGYFLVILGERGHPEINGIVACAAGEHIVLESADEVNNLPRRRKVGLVVQTTQSQSNLVALVSELIKRVGELRVYNTICNATMLRQRSALELARKTDLMLVVGGRNSANTTRLAEICKGVNAHTFHLETAEEIEERFFQEVGTLGITAGASTPDWIIEEIVQKIKVISSGAPELKHGRAL
ncbi:4-hydroxy-3-methylbut-2-en-1-yl diphosphate reductase [Candidatus Hakubella thermalkaliphila]|uniref:4-hydroxy-3-methylbut-2-enyl diphosphate reductase n=2 Tax=Candidatus Hakubella thermalkaliphila TaxID=2754717 RepID=A0A6V8Q676_9ACTN|nr:4-hydroxy-3-methylbut-2-en-1-yl diphosphate reductase [Candidatus Hakubella thermalkaliphila]